MKLTYFFLHTQRCRIFLFLNLNKNISLADYFLFLLFLFYFFLKSEVDLFFSSNSKNQNIKKKIISLRHLELTYFFSPPRDADRLIFHILFLSEIRSRPIFFLPTQRCKTAALFLHFIPPPKPKADSSRRILDD